MDNIIYSKYSNERTEKFQIRTDIIENSEGKRFVRKIPLTQDAYEHINNIYKYYKLLSKLYEGSRLCINNCHKSDMGLEFEYIPGNTLEEELDELLFKKDYEQLVERMTELVSILKSRVGNKVFKPTKEFVKVFGDVKLPFSLKAGDINNIDFVFNNIIVGRNLQIIDYEWTFEFLIPFNYIIYRSIYYYISGSSRRSELVNLGLYKLFGISDEELVQYRNMEKNFQSYVLGDLIPLRDLYGRTTARNVNVRQIMEQKNVDLNKNTFQVFFDYGEGFNETQSYKFNPILDEYGQISFEILITPNVKQVRIDPANDKCIVSVYSLIGYNMQYYILNSHTNGINVSEDTILFLTEDPNIILTDIKQETTVLKLKFEVQIISEKIALELCKVATRTNDLNNKIESYKDQYNLAAFEIDKLKNRLSNVETAYNTISNSMCWRITKPIRISLDAIKKVAKINQFIYIVKKVFHYLKKNGVRKTSKKIKSVLNRKKMLNESGICEKESQNIILNISKIQPLQTFKKSIAVHVHLYYADLIDEFIRYLNNIPYNFDLFISCKEKSDISQIREKLEKINNVKNIDVETTINRGRDIAPLYVQFGKKIEQYDYFLHIHTKKSLYSGKERYGWRQYSLDCLLGNENIVKSIFALFESDKNVGLFIPEVYDDVPAMALDWLANAEKGRKIIESLGMPFEDGVFTYPVGSFFWARMDAVKPLFEYNFKYEDFPEELGQTDGTTAHALERAIAFVSKNRGYQIAIHEYQSKNVYFGKTLKPFQGYFKEDINSVVSYLSQYDVLSFDIFDTLITRCVYQPDDVFNLMSRKIKGKYGKEINFLKIRKKAEAFAWEKYHNYCSIDNIYDELPKVAKISKEMAIELKQMEIDTELSICIPRCDVVEIFNRLKNYGKKIILVSDMYLTSNIIKKILSRCGVTGYDDLWVSCEKGVRKDDNTIWPLFFTQYSNYKTIHVGDNMRSDIQILGDQGKEAFLILNPITEFKLSKIYSKLKKYVNTTVENSLVLGMVVNGGLCNSPFSPQLGSGEPFINEGKKLGYIAFGSIFTNFINRIYKQHKQNEVLLFLAREGYLLKKIYETFYESINKKDLNSIYFLSSRRAVSLAAISNEEDIKTVISQYYDGGLKNLLRARLGIDLYSDMHECRIKMPEDENKVMNMLKFHMNDIIKKANEEAKLYREYINEILGKAVNKELTVIDVGYSGTIQYYLSKLINKRISGYYLCMGINKKPERLGCKCKAIYNLNTDEDVRNSKIFKGQLFLEAALQAPYGQLLCFKKVNEKVIPQYKSDNKVPVEIADLQNGIIEYCRQYATIIKDFVDDVEMDKDLVEDIFYEILFNGNFSNEICNAFNVQDDYCSNGNQKFDIKDKKWNVI